MRILQVARYGSIRGGVETYVAALSEGLRDAGHDVGLLYGMEPDAGRPEVAAGALVPALVEPAARPPAGGADALVAAIDAFAPDVVHVHVPEVSWVAPLAATRAPTLLAVHDHRLDCPVGTKYWAGWEKVCTVRPGPWCLAYNVTAHCGSLRANATLRPYRSWRAARRAAMEGPGLQVFSDAMREALAVAGFDRARVGVTHYPVPPRASHIPPEDPDPRPVVLASGRLTKEKGFGHLIEAFEHVTVPCHLVIAGAGHERPVLERRARMVGRRHRITFTDWLDARRLAGWRREAVLVALPSMWPEPFGIVGLEAMDAGLPVVAFDVGGIGEWLRDGETGRLVPPGDVRAFGEAITALMQDGDMRARMGAAAAERAAAFSMARHLEALLPLYREAGA